MSMIQYISTKSILLRLLSLFLFISRLAIQPNRDKGYPSSNSDPDPSYPCPAPTNLPASRIFIVCEMANCDFALDVDVGQEGPLVIDAEGKYAVLVGGAEGGAEKGAVGCGSDGGKVETVEGREHGEFELEGVFGGNSQGGIMILRVLGKFNGESLSRIVSDRRVVGWLIETYNIVLDAVDRRIQVSQLRHIVVTLGVRVDRTQMMLDTADLQNSSLHERPAGDLFGKFPIRGLALLSIKTLDLRIEPLVLQCLNGTKHRKASRVASLHGGDKRYLFSDCERIIYSLRVFFRIIAVCRALCS